MTNARWPRFFLACLLLVALFGDFIANDRPVVCRYDGGLRFPVLSDNSDVRNWKQVDTDWSVWPPIRYRSGTTDLANANYKPPFAATRGDGGRHWLGTDRLGRDTAAGLVNGTRVAVLVGLGSLVIALLIGIPLGAVGGFFGDDRLRWGRGRLFGALFGLTVGGGYAAGALYPALGGGLAGLIGGLCCALLCAAVFSLLAGASGKRIPWLRKPVRVPVDRVVVQLIELTVSIPGLILLIAVLSIVSRPSIWLVVAIIGLLSWTGVARFLRAELLRIRNLPYIDAARVSGVPPLRILFRHALPNAIGPVVVVAAFLVGISILSEAMLSFLGVGVPSDQVTWGSLLQQSRLHPSAWWLAVFPGVLLTLTVLACNRIGGRRWFFRAGP